MDRTDAKQPARNSNQDILTYEEWNRVATLLKLSSRELQITQHVFDDVKTEAIALALGISVHTVNTYFTRLYIKLSVCSRPQLIVKVLCNVLNDTASIDKSLSVVYRRNGHGSDMLATGQVATCSTSDERHTVHNNRQSKRA